MSSREMSWGGSAENKLDELVEEYRTNLRSSSEQMHNSTSSADDNEVSVTSINRAYELHRLPSQAEIKKASTLKAFLASANFIFSVLGGFFISKFSDGVWWAAATVGTLFLGATAAVVNHYTSGIK